MTFIEECIPLWLSSPEVLIASPAEFRACCDFWKKLVLVLLLIVLVQGIYVAAGPSSRVTLDVNIKSLLYFRGLSFRRVKKKLLKIYS